MRKTGIAIVSMLVTMLLAACGGGGGGGGVVAPPPVGAITITTANAEQVSAVVVGSVDSLVGASSGSVLITGVSVSTSGSGIDLPGILMSQLDRFAVIRQQQLSSGIVGVVIGPLTDTCSSGGTVTVSGNVADQFLDTFSAGDTLTADFSNCNEFGIVFNGGLDLTINTVNPDPFDGLTLPYVLDFSVDLRNFAVADAGDIFISQGDMQLVISEGISGDMHEVLSGTSIIVSVNGVVDSLANYNYDIQIDAIGNYSIDISGTMTSSILGGTVTYTTLTPFTGTDPGDPTAGVLFMESDSDASQAILTAQPDGINILIDVDTDGDGTYEGMVPTTWATLDSL
jgi:hypothetical protein